MSSAGSLCFCFGAAAALCRVGRPGLMSSSGSLCFCFGAAAALCGVGRPGPDLGQLWSGVGRGRSAWGVGSVTVGRRIFSVAVFVVVCFWAVVLFYVPILKAVYMKQYRTSQVSINLFRLCRILLIVIMRWSTSDQCRLFYVFGREASQKRVEYLLDINYILYCSYRLKSGIV